MNTFISYKKEFDELLQNIVTIPLLHARWLNTLSYLENCGARKIAACEHPTLVKKEMLKHAAEEFRHAHYLKSQIGRVVPESLETYGLHEMLGGVVSRHYLNSLDILTSRYLLSQGITAGRLNLDLAVQDAKAMQDYGSKDCVDLESSTAEFRLKEYSYHLVTYAIELRAQELYPIYDAVLRQNKSKVTVKSIVLEEKEHLEEMKHGLNLLPSGWEYAARVCKIEGILCGRWLQAIADRIGI